MKKFVSLHNHTTYSIKDGLYKPGDYIKKVQELGGTAYALTDHGTMAGCFDFYDSCKKLDIKPLLGLEAYFVDDKKTKDKPQHILLLAKNLQGYKSLLKAQYDSCKNGFYFKPRIDWSNLQEMSHNVICSTACSGGVVAKPFIEKDMDRVKMVTEKLLDIFGSDFYYEYVALNRVGHYKDLWQGMYEFAKQYNIKSIVTADVHYIHKQDYKLQQILHNLDNEQIKLNDLEQGKGWVMQDHDLYIKNYDEIMFIMSQIFDKEIVENLIANTVEIENKIEKFNIYPEGYVFPRVDFKEDDIKNIIKHNLEEKIPQEKIQVYKERLNYEYKVIKNMGFLNYFGIVADIVKWSKDNRIFVGAGRGSAAGSLVSYLLGITDVDPIKFGLSFERFLNPSRCVPPNTKIITKNGVKKIFDVNKGDSVKTMGGEYCKIKNKMVNSINENIINIQYEGGSVKCTSNHKLIVWRNNKVQEILASDLLLEDKLIEQTSMLIDIKSIKSEKYKGEVIDIEVENNHNFYMANNENDVFVLSHNSKMPDIDTDFQKSQRGKVLSYMKKWGEDNVVQIGSYNELTLKSALKAVLRINDISFQEANDVSNNIEEPSYIQKYKKYYDVAEKLIGNIQHLSKHAAGVIITDKPVYEYMPVVYNSQLKDVVSAIDGDTLTSKKFLKIDILGLNALDIINDSVEYIHKYENIKVDVFNITLNDDNVLSMFRNGDLNNIFQFDTYLMKKLLPEAAPDRFRHLAEINAINRPGPLTVGMDKLYVQRRFGAKYTTPKLLEKHLSKTYGLLIYQEQVISILSDLLDISPGQADIHRKELEKGSIKDIMNANNYYTILYKKYSKEDIEEAFEFIQESAGYLFNFSHSVSYSLLAYQMAYLKCYYRKYFNLAVLNNLDIAKKVDQEKMKKTLEECKQWNFKLKPYNLNEMSLNFTLDKNGDIIKGATAIKGLGEKGLLDIVVNKPYSNVEDFLIRAKPQKNVLETLNNEGFISNTFGIKISNEDLLHRRDSLCKKKGNIAKVKTDTLF